MLFLHKSRAHDPRRVQPPRERDSRPKMKQQRHRHGLSPHAPPPLPPSPPPGNLSGGPAAARSAGRGNVSEPEPPRRSDTHRIDRGHASEPEVPVREQIRLHVATNSMGLVELNLANRGLRSVPDEVFTLTRVEMLLLANNRLQSIPPAVCHLFRLKLLDASGNDLRALPDTVCNCTHLTELYLHRNRLSALPRQLALLSQLRSARLSSNAFESLPPEFGQLTALRRLDLSDNSLWTLPESFAHLSHLRQLSLSDNAFTEFPLCVCRLRRLELLDFSRNKLRAIPDDLEQVKGLQEVNLSSNLLDSFPTVLCSVRGLSALDLSDNSLTGISMRLSKLSRLKVLLLNRNSIEHLLDNLAAVERLDVSENQLRALSVVNMKRLKVLAAKGNRLDAMPVGVYNLPDLEILQLGGNRISYVSQDVVLLKKLRVLDLSDNVLKLLPQAIEEMEQLESLVISGNNVRMRKRPGEQQTAYLLRSAEPQSGVENRIVRPLTIDQSFRNVDGNSQQQTKSIYRQTNGFISNAKSPMTSPKMAKAIQRGKEKPKWQTKQQGFSSAPEHVNRGRLDEEGEEVPGILRSREWLFSPREQSMSSVSPAVSFFSEDHPAIASAQNRRSPKPKTAADRDAVLLSNPLSVDEITYPLTQADVTDARNDVIGEGGGRFERESRIGPLVQSSSFAKNAEEDQRRKKIVQRRARKAKSADDPLRNRHATRRADVTLAAAGGAEEEEDDDHVTAAAAASDPENASDTVTVNDAIGDELSLGDEDFEFLPLNVKDDKLMRMAGELETMLNHQLLQPIIGGSIFRKSFNQSGTLRTLKGLTGELLDDDRPKRPGYRVSRALSDRPPPPPLVNGRSLEDVFRPSGRSVYAGYDGGAAPPVLRSRADVFHVGPSGGLFRSSSNRGVNVYFPRNAVESNVSITVQIETIASDFLEEAKRFDPILSTLLSVGEIVRITDDGRATTELERYVTLRIPAPSGVSRGQLHILTFKEDSTCVPCVFSYKVYHGFISIKAWHIAGKGAVVTKTGDKFKVCRAMERLLEFLDRRSKTFGLL